MKREEDWLKEACAQLAQEEADQMESSLTRSEIRQAEEAYRRHRGRALSLIARRTGHGGGWTRYWTAAAALLVISLALYFSIRPESPDPVKLAQIPTVSVAPYFSPAPTETPSSTNPPVYPTKEPINPTDVQIIAEKHTVKPTDTPKPTIEPTAAPTEPPAVSGWQGEYFPATLPDDAVFLACEGDENGCTARWQWGEGELVFTENREPVLLQPGREAEVSYVQWGDIVALRLREDGKTTLSWVQDGRGFTLQGDFDEIDDIAKSVQKLNP